MGGRRDREVRVVPGAAEQRSGVHRRPGKWEEADREEGDDVGLRRVVAGQGQGIDEDGQAEGLPDAQGEGAEVRPDYSCDWPGALLAPLHACVLVLRELPPPSRCLGLLAHIITLSICYLCVVAQYAYNPCRGY